MELENRDWKSMCMNFLHFIMNNDKMHPSQSHLSKNKPFLAAFLPQNEELPKSTVLPSFSEVIVT